ncbi:DUF3021 family protein [Vagococcus proximus]|uniref:DUF3021 family protein n=1 Tax=Vagococcus proximus TaxID=2991417 RepID=UPI0034631F8F
MPIAIYLNWINFTTMNILIFTLIFIIVYLIIWTVSMMKRKKDITIINKTIR